MPILPRVRLGTVVSQGPPADVAAAQARALAADRTPTYIHVFTNPQKTKFFINGKVFDENRTDVFVRLGHVEEWTILNKDTQYHDFHIHQTGFLVTDVNGRSTRFDGLRDTFSVPPMVSGKPGEMKAIIPFTNPTMLGRFVFHCHVVKHAQTLPDIGPVPRLTLRDAVSGSKLLPQLAGKSVLVSFIAPRCTSTCPLTEGTIARVQDALRHTGRLSSRVALVLIATDIAHDTAAELRHLTRATGAISNVFHYATGSKEALNEVLQGYGVTVVPTEGSDGDLDHTAATYLVDKNSRVRAVFSPNAAPSTITQAIERL